MPESKNPSTRSWQLIAAEVIAETDSKKLAELIAELAHALAEDSPPNASSQATPYR